MPNSFKKSIVAGALALTIMAGSPVAQAQSPSMADLQAQIAQLLAQINQLQGQLTGAPAVSPVGQYVWTRSLTIGSTGADVQKLQQFLNASADTRVALSGAGAPGFETMYYGPATAAAVSKFQVKYRSEILTPNGLVNPTGYFGPATIAKANALAATPVNPNPITPTNPTTPEEEVVQLRGEGTLAVLEIQSASNNDIKEASSDSVVAEVTLEATDGDIEISRLDVALVADPGNTERDPWDTFETISLWVDGDMIAEERIDDRSDYLNRNQGTVRFSNLDLVIEEDEDVEVLIAVSVQNNIRGAGTDADWNVSVERLRFFDGDGVATDDSSTGDLGDSVSFSIVERGFGEELKFSIGPNNPDTSNIIVDDSRRTNNVTILEYTLEAIDADIELDTLYVNIETGTASYDDVVSDVRLQIGNETFRKDAVLSTGAYSATSTRVAFDIDGDVTIDAEDKETVKVIVDLKPRTAYANGETITARVTSAERDITDAEGSDDIETFVGTAIGKVHTLISEGIVVPVDDVRFNISTLGQNDTTGVYTINFDVTAVEGDFYITEYAATSTGTTTGGVQFSVETPVGEPTTITGTLTSTADEDSLGVFTVREGQTERFTLTVTVDASAAGQHRVLLESIYFSADTDGTTGSERYDTLPVSSFRTAYSFINN